MTNGHQAQDTDTWRAQSYLIGHPLGQRERFGEALVIYQDVIQLHESLATALSYLEREGEAQQAMAHYQHMVSTNA